MTITQDKLLNALADPTTLKPIYKISTTSAASTWVSFWKVVSLPIAGVNPPLFTAGSGYVPTNLTTGAIPNPNAAAGNRKYVGSMNMSTTIAGVFMVYDRIWACSGFNTTVTTAQVITTPGTLPTNRNPNNGLDIEPWIEFYTAPGATAATWTLIGTDSTGTTGRTWTYAHGAAAETINRIMPMTNGTAIGGCRVPESFTCSVSSGTAGDVGITLVRRIAAFPLIVANWGVAMDALALGLPNIPDDACAATMMQCTTTATGTVLGQINIVEMTP